MPSYVPPKRATELIFYIGLVSQADTKLFQTNPTIAAGDFKVSLDGGALNNLATLPAVTPASSKSVKFVLSAAEMTADNIQIIGSDAAGAEWCDVEINIQTTARQTDDLAFPATSGRSLLVAAAGGIAVDWANVQAPTTVVGLTNTTISTTQVVASVAGAVGSVTGAVGSVVAAVTTSAADQASSADALLARNIAGGSYVGRSVSEALYVLRNRVIVSALGVVTVYLEDDVTPAWSGVATRTAGANPITEVDPT